MALKDWRRIHLIRPTRYPLIYNGDVTDVWEAKNGSGFLTIEKRLGAYKFLDMRRYKMSETTNFNIIRWNRFGQKESLIFDTLTKKQAMKVAHNYMRRM